MNGTFKETHVGGTPTRSFHRTFVIVPNNSGGFSITNDMLFVTNTTKEQVNFFIYFKYLIQVVPLAIRRVGPDPQIGVKCSLCHNVKIKNRVTVFLVVSKTTRLTFIIFIVYLVDLMRIDRKVHMAR